MVAEHVAVVVTVLEGADEEPDRRTMRDRDEPDGVGAVEERRQIGPQEPSTELWEQSVGEILVVDGRYCRKIAMAHLPHLESPGLQATVDSYLCLVAHLGSQTQEAP